MTYESGRKTGDLAKELHRLGKGLARGRYFKALADAVMDSPILRRAFEEGICSDILKECKNLCSKGNASMLRSAAKESVLNFSWQTLVHKIKDTLAFVLRHPSFLKTATRE